MLTLQEELFIKFAEFEEKVKEVDRARAIYRYALDHIPREQARRPPVATIASHRRTLSMTATCGLHLRRLHLARAEPQRAAACVLSKAPARCLGSHCCGALGRGNFCS